MTTTETAQSAPTAKPAKKAPRVNWHDHYDELKAVHNELADCSDVLVRAVEAMHNEQHGGAFRHCPHPVCDAANVVDYADEEEG